MKEVMGLAERRFKHLLDDLKEQRGYWELQEEALDRSLWRTRFERLWPFVRQTAEWMKVVLILG
jgi:hypothetical protein